MQVNLEQFQTRLGYQADVFFFRPLWISQRESSPHSVTAVSKSSRIVPLLGRLNRGQLGASRSVALSQRGFLEYGIFAAADCHTTKIRNLPSVA